MVNIEIQKIDCKPSANFIKKFVVKFTFLIRIFYIATLQQNNLESIKIMRCQKARITIQDCLKALLKFDYISKIR